MADPFGYTGSSTGSSTSNRTLMPILDDPRLGDLFSKIQGVTPTSLAPLNSLVGQGMNSPLLQQILGPALARLMGTEDVSRQAVTDAARSAGGLRGTAYGQSFAANEQNLMQNRGNLVSDVIAKTLGTLVPGMLQEQQNSFLPGRTLIDLLQASRPMAGGGGSSSYDESGWGNIPQSLGLGAQTGLGPLDSGIRSPFGGGGGFGNSAPGVTQQQPPLPISKPYYDPYAGQGGGYGVTLNPQTNSYVSNPFNAGGQQVDSYGFSQQDWANDPYYNQ